MAPFQKQYGIVTLLMAGALLLAIIAAGCTGGGAPQTTPVTTVAPSPETTIPATTPPVQPTVAMTPSPTVSPAPSGTYAVQQIPGKLRVTGSTTVLPIAQMEADAYMEKNLRADIQVSGGGSSVGVQAIGEGTADIGMSSREISDTEKAKYPGLVPTDIATDAVVLIVHPSNPVTALTLDQVRGLYNGTFQGWNSVGGTLTFPVIIGRDSASGTRVYFSEAVMKNEKYRPDMREMNSNGAVAQAVAQTPAAIGYVGLGFIDSTVKALEISSNGQPVAPTIPTVLAHQYPISRPLYMITNGQPTGLAKDYIEFIISPDGQKIVQDQGFVPLS
ncbi:MAG: phosphate ABC transporter substrate-binding protein PstS family protein [Methanomicrobiales archaeon]|nr:phosphate ABC transporter substrate-binding protein PstS family protein [Methanomicrobiales archaeon]